MSTFPVMYIRSTLLLFPQEYHFVNPHPFGGVYRNALHQPYHFRVRSISPEPFENFSLNFTQMFLSVSKSAEPMAQLPRLKVKITFQSHVIYPLISCPLLIS